MGIGKIWIRIGNETDKYGYQAGHHRNALCTESVIKNKHKKHLQFKCHLPLTGKFISIDVMREQVAQMMICDIKVQEKA